jgi:hypothetical protein
MHVHAELDPATQISGLRKSKLTSCAPTFALPGPGFVLSESPANQSPVFVWKAASDLVSIGLIEIEPVGLTEQESCSRSASIAWLRRHHCGDPLLPDCYFNEVALEFAPEPCIFVWLLVGQQAVPESEPRLACLHFGRTISVFMNENNSARNHLPLDRDF